jgi:hypothetical protein
LLAASSINAGNVVFSSSNNSVFGHFHGQRHDDIQRWRATFGGSTAVT